MVLKWVVPWRIWRVSDTMLKLEFSLYCSSCYSSWIVSGCQLQSPEFLWSFNNFCNILVHEVIGCWWFFFFFYPFWSGNRIGSSWAGYWVIKNKIYISFEASNFHHLDLIIQGNQNFNLCNYHKCKILTLQVEMLWASISVHFDILGFGLKNYKP